MDWHKLQHTLYNMDPTDPKEDLAKLRSQAEGNNAAAPVEKNYVTESAEVDQGSLPVGIDSLSDFAALAGVTLTESQKAGDYARGSDPVPKAKAGRTEHPLKDKLVGDSMDQDVDEGPLDAAKKGFQAGRQSYQSGAFAPDSAEKAVKDKLSSGSNKGNDDKEKSSRGAPSMRLATALGTSNTTLMNQAIQRLQQGQPLSRNHYAPLEQAFKNMLTMDRRELQRVMAIMALGSNESVGEAKEKSMPKERNPVVTGMQKSGQGVHKDKKKELPRKEKHQGKMQTESIKDELYKRLNAKK